MADETGRRKTKRAGKAAGGRSKAAPKEAEPVRLAADVRMVPLHYLSRDPVNVRRTDAEGEVASLADSIYAHGLQSPLSVRLDDPPEDPTAYSVIAGGRRLAALRLLASDGRIKTDEPVPCVVHRDGDDEAAVERASLAENLDRLPMNVVDQLDVFRRQADERGYSEKDLAAAYGQTPKRIRQVLALARLHPDLLALLRDDKLTVRSAELLTQVSDQAEQLRVHKAAHGEHWQIERIVRGERITADDRLVKLVGLKAYQAAGGTMPPNLFATEDRDKLLDDPALLRRLATEKLDAELAKLLEEGYAFGTHELTKGAPEHTWNLDRVATPPKSKKGKAAVAVHLELNYSGKLNAVHYRPSKADAKRHGVELPADAKPGKSGSSTAKAKAGGLSPATVYQITSERTEILRDALMRDPDAALDLLLTAMVMPLLRSVAQTHAFAYDVPLEITASHGLPDSHTVGYDKPLTNRGGAYHGRLKELGKLVPAKLKSAAELLAWIVGLDAGEKRELLALCVASTLNASSSPGGGLREKAAELALARLDVDLADRLRPGESYFSKRTKDEIAADVAEATGDKSHKAELLAMKKKDAVKRAIELVGPTRWMPKALRVGLDGAGKLYEAALAARPAAAGTQTQLPRACRVCGCTDADCRGCIERTGEPCQWVEADLCSACAAGAVDGVERPATSAKLEWRRRPSGDVFADSVLRDEKSRRQVWCIDRASDGTWSVDNSDKLLQSPPYDGLEAWNPPEHFAGDAEAVAWCEAREGELRRVMVDEAGGGFGADGTTPRTDATIELDVGEPHQAAASAAQIADGWWAAAYYLRAGGGHASRRAGIFDIAFESEDEAMSEALALLSTAADEVAGDASGVIMERCQRERVRMTADRERADDSPAAAAQRISQGVAKVSKRVKKAADLLLKGGAEVRG